MSNQPENDYISLAEIKNEFKRAKKRGVIILIISSISLFLWPLLLTGVLKSIFPAISPAEKDFKKEMKAIQVTVDSLKKDRIKIEEFYTGIRSEMTMLYKNDSLLKLSIRTAQNNLTNIKKQYEKIPSYAGVSVDSLHRLFSSRFGK